MKDCEALEKIEKLIGQVLGLDEETGLLVKKSQQVHATSGQQGYRCL
ncbi:hypothetical protein JCM15831A_12040 [Asaia astilbis]